MLDNVLVLAEEDAAGPDLDDDVAETRSNVQAMAPGPRRKALTMLRSVVDLAGGNP